MAGTICPHGESSFRYVRQGPRSGLGAHEQYVVWLFATRTLKLLPHLWQHPSHIIYVPAWILFGYYL